MRILLSLIALVLGGVCRSEAAPAPMRQSEQFTVVDARPVSAFSPGQLRTLAGKDLVRLDADVLLLSAERVKEVLLAELGSPPVNPGKIRLFLYSATRADNLVRVASSIHTDGWQYRLDIPDQIEARQLTRALVHGLLLEIANRGQGPKSAELPLWLVEGLTAHLLAVAGRDLVIGAVPIGKMFRIVSERKGLDYLRGARETLRNNRPLSFSELAYPTRESLTGDPLTVYQASAHLFVYELLRLKKGPDQLVWVLRELPQCWNWETAFLRGFASEFRRMLDVEKKWSVDVMAFTARDSAQFWSMMVCLGRLDEVLAVQTVVRVAADTLPEKQVMTLQQIMVGWDFSRQADVIRPKLALLEVLRFHSADDLAVLVNDYHQTLSEYLHKREIAARTPETRMQPSLSASWVAQRAIKELELLDKRREALRPEKLLSVNPLISP